ncbi:MAG: hypothetical protein ACE148_16335 [Vicinamibacterales bacterium]
MTAPLESTLRLVEDVIVERVLGDEMWVVSATPGRPEERLAVDRLGSAPPMLTGVKVVGSDPVMLRGKLCHRIRLAMLANHHWQRDLGIHGGLVRAVPVKLVDVSRGGCLLMSDIPVDAGTHGELQVRAEAGECWDALRVSRCSHVDGSSGPFRIGAEFLRPQVSDRFGVRFNGSARSVADDIVSLERQAGT